MPPFSINPERDTICDVIRRWAEIQPDAPAIIGGGKKPLTYGALTTVMDEIRAALNRSGLGHGDRVGRRCQSKILNTLEGRRTALLDPEKFRKINDREIHFRRLNKVIDFALTTPENAFKETRQDLSHRPTLREGAAKDQGFCAGWN